MADARWLLCWLENLVNRKLATETHFLLIQKNNYITLHPNHRLKNNLCQLIAFIRLKNRNHNIKLAPFLCKLVSVILSHTISNSNSSGHLWALREVQDLFLEDPPMCWSVAVLCSWSFLSKTLKILCYKGNRVFLCVSKKENGDRMLERGHSGNTRYNQRKFQTNDNKNKGTTVHSLSSTN